MKGALIVWLGAACMAAAATTNDAAILSTLCGGGNVLVTDYGTLGRSPEVKPPERPPTRGPVPTDEPPAPSGGAKVIQFRPRKR